MARKALLLIDPQNDFCNPDHGALGVPGAENDSLRIKEMIENSSFEDIFVTMDTHYVLDISHPLFWEDENGNNPDPLTPIKYEEVGTKWFPRFQKHWASYYVKILEDEGKYDHMIWPEHCIHGSWGHMIEPNIMKGLRSWSAHNNMNFRVIEKGKNINTEHFGAFQAQVPFADDSETQFNQDLYDQLSMYDEVHVAGEAESHCVAYTLDQLIGTELAKKLVVHKSDKMSPVPGFEGVADNVYSSIEKDGGIIK